MPDRAPRLSGPRTRIETSSAAGAMAWTIPAHAVPWPTRSPSIRIVDDARSVVAGLDPQAADQPAADRRVIGLDARVDDRDGDAAPVPVAERRAPVHRPERARRGRGRRARPA